MNEFILHNEALLRIGFFISTLLILLICEIIIPRRLNKFSKLLRWQNNLLLVILNTLLVRMIFPIGLVGIAFYIKQHQYGLFNYLQINSTITFVLSLIILDLAIYWQHRIFHLVPMLWQLHQVHHADMDYDVTTGLRFHPLEIIISMFFKAIIIITLGIPVNAVIIFEIILNSLAMFNHSNIKLPTKIDQLIRMIIVTPDMHRIHHSVLPTELNHNFGFNLSYWDNLFRTYQSQPSLGHTKMIIGLSNIQNPKITQNLLGMLKMPLIKYNKHKKNI